MKSRNQLLLLPLVLILAMALVVPASLAQQRRLVTIASGWVVYPYTEHRLEIGGRTLDLSKEVGAGGRVSITVRPPITRWAPKSP